MLSDACSDFNSAVANFVFERISRLKDELDNYDQPPFDYHRGEIPAIRRAIAAFENDPHSSKDMIALLHILERVREFHDTPPDYPYRLDVVSEWWERRQHEEPIT
jgi:hypothetical protein